MPQNFIPNEDEIFEAILNAPVSAVAREEASPLIDAWVAQCAEIDAQDRTIAVEIPWFLEVGKNTFIVGTIDRLAGNDMIPVFPAEHKSTAKRSPARGSFPGWNADRWLEDIMKSHQVPTYAAAVARGARFIGLAPEEFPFCGPTDIGNGPGWHVLVRAASKSNPVEIWPSPRGAFITVSEERIENTLNAYRVTAEQIRASRRSGLLPWGLPGHHCTKFGKYVCDHYMSCTSWKKPPAGVMSIGSFSPGSQEAVKAVLSLYAKNDCNDTNELVILSASTLADWQQCPERFRRNAMGNGHEASDAQETGTVLHSALASLYSQMMRRK